ncbi:MAG: 30S ribosomal protein S4 [Ignavibacteriales bacterium]|nr:30S ribosomal protein S4 [Ignavibacteriales bacterium]
MARNRESIVKLSRKLGIPLTPKASKYMERRPYGPGQHGKGRRSKVSEYGLQLKEKQKMKYTYGVLERQFRNYFEKALSMKGKTGDNLVKLLERRLDNVVYRLGLAPTRRTARQLVVHGHFRVNEAKVDIPSYSLSPGDVISVREKSRKLDVIHNSLRRVKDTSLYGWLAVDKAVLSGTFVNVPEREEVPLNINEQLIVELYSK